MQNLTVSVSNCIREFRNSQTLHLTSPTLNSVTKPSGCTVTPSWLYSGLKGKVRSKESLAAIRYRGSRVCSCGVLPLAVEAEIVPAGLAGDGEVACGVLAFVAAVLSA